MLKFTTERLILWCFN